MNKILLASNNDHKIKEIRSIIKEFNVDVEIVSPKDMGCSIEPKEDGFSFKENAHKKAKYYYDLYKLPTIADDSGLCIKYFNWGPGIHSARFYQDLSHLERNKKVLSLLNNVKDREAHFVCNITYLDENGFHDFEGRLIGEISKEIRGVNGFGYDPIFYLKDYDKCLAEFDPESKNKLSHRYLATRKCVEYLETK